MRNGLSGTGETSGRVGFKRSQFWKEPEKDFSPQFHGESLAGKEDMIAKGFKEVRFKNFADLIDSVTKKGSFQKAAHDTLIETTESRNETIRVGLAIIRKVQNAARSTFGRNKTKPKEFRIRTDTSKSVGKTAAFLDHLAGVCAKYHDELLGNGLAEEDFAAITTAYANLVTSDSIQRIECL